MNDIKKYMEGNYSSDFPTAVSERLEDIQEASKLVIEAEILETYMACLKKRAEEHHYLVDGAILTCTKCKEEPDEFNGESFCVPEGISKRKLVVTHNSTAINGAGQCFATVDDSEMGDNIFSFGNCKNPPDRDKEREALLDASKSEESRKLGTCHYLMDLNDQWENIISDTGYKKVTGEDGELLETITMEAILFCKHGGFIYPKHSGYIETDGEIEELNEMQQYIKSILEALGWTTDFEELQEIEDVLNDFNITDRNSIACFLLLCITESGPEGAYSGIIARDGNPYVNERGRAVTEYYPKDKTEYSFEARGVGYIMVTKSGAQKKCLEDLKEMGYYEKDLDIDSMTGGYIDELRKKPWAVSAWRWAVYYGDETKDDYLNAYVPERVKENDGCLTIGIVLTAESFINGKVSEKNMGTKTEKSVNGSSIPVDDVLGPIASGEIAHIEKSDAEKSDSYKGWYTDGENLYVDGWRYGAPRNWDNFENNYNILKKQGIIQ